MLLLHRTLEMNVVSEEVHPESYDRVDAEAAMQAEMVSGESGCGKTMRAESGTGCRLVDLGAGSAAWEVAQAVSVAAAYFEDTLGGPPEVLFCGRDYQCR